MSDKTELLTVEVEKHPISYDKGRRAFKDHWAFLLLIGFGYV